MTKANLGTKRICPNCGTRYYDLDRNPIVCPRCGTYFEASAATARARPEKAVEEDDEDLEVEEAAEADLVPLEDADEETADTGAVKVDGAEDDEVEEEDETEEEDTFLEEEDEEGDDVADIIGDVDDEER